jgi:hypothetical protein
MIRSGGRVFLHQESKWYLWEPSWGMYRPIDSLRWDGHTMRVDDSAYCKDPTDPMYGYGHQRIYNKCFNLTQEFPDIESAKHVSCLTIGIPEWFRDRSIAMTPCAPRTLDSWKRLNLKRRTVRIHPRKTFTKRNTN